MGLAIKIDITPTLKSGIALTEPMLTTVDNSALEFLVFKMEYCFSDEKIYNNIKMVMSVLPSVRLSRACACACTGVVGGRG